MLAPSPAGFRRLLPLLKPHRRRLVAGGLCMLVYVACWPVLAWLAGRLIPAIGAGDFPAVLRAVGGALAVFLIQKVAQFGQDTLLAGPALRVSQELRRRVFDRLQRLEFGALEKLSAGDLTYRLTEDADRVGEVIYKTIQDTTPSVLQLVVVLGYMIWLDVPLALATLLLAPLVESFFGLLTRARLLELADLERPLLRRLSTEAPGTFEHTLMICGLAEEGARAIHADIDLIRTGALYHDVGKLHAPNWFIENQEEGLNPHDALDDPFASAAILQAHVDEGLKLARRYRLPRPLADFIPEHQGTLKMGYFLHQARGRDPSVPEARFRYRGPIPRSRETAILMLADGCEAALRSLPPGTREEEARSMVRRIIEARMRDGQLAASGISRAELELVIRAFVRVWRRMRHRRIPYPIPAGKAFSA